MSCRLTVWASVLAFSGIASAQQAAEFKQNLSTGTTWKFDQSQDSDLNNTASFQGQQQQFAVKNHQHRAGTVEILEAANGEPTKLKVTFDSDCVATQEMNGQSQPVPFPYAGQSVTITKDAGGAVTDDFTGQADPANQLELHEYFDQDTQLYPKKPIKIGEEWSGDPQVLGRVLGLSDPRDRGGLTCKLLEMKNDGGKRVASVKVSLAVVKFEGQLQTQLISQGTAEVDLATGHVIGTALKGSIQLSGKQQAPGQDGQPMSVDVQGKGSMTAQSTSPISGGTSPAPQPTLPTADDQNPLAEKAADPLPGNYSDGKLTVSFSPSNTSYIGTVKMNGKNFPAQAKKQGDGYQGSFQSGSQWFNFKATLDGDTLSLTTGKTTYKLKKDQVNPLDDAAPAAPANPLSPGGGTGPHASLKLPAGLDALAATDHGAAWVFAASGPSSARKAISAAMQKAGSAFDAVPKLGSVVIDDKDTVGFVPFTARSDNQDINGKAVALHTGMGEFVAIVACSTSAPAAEWKQLTDAMPTIPAMHEVRLPGNMGSIDLPDGWKLTFADSSNGAMMAEGPDHASVTRGIGFFFTTDDFFRAPGMMPPRPGQLVSNYLQPREAIEYLSRESQKPGSKAQIHINKILGVQPLPFQSGYSGPSAAAVMVTDESIARDGQRFDAMEFITLSTFSSSRNDWGAQMEAMTCEKSKFGKELPMLMEIYSSYHLNLQQLNENNKVATAGMIDRAKAMSDAQKKTFEAGMASAADREKARHASAMDTVEMLRGTRSVYDEKQGTLSDVDLGNSRGIVSSLNDSAGYQRFHEVPLRDQQ